MNKEFYSKLVDMYAGGDLPEDLMKELEDAAMDDPALSHDMYTLKRIVESIQTQMHIDFGDESYYRILTKMQSQGAEIETHAPEPTFIQYHLPMQG